MSNIKDGGILPRSFSDERNLVLTEVSLPANMERMTWLSFSGCKLLKKVKMPRRLGVLENAFNSCTELEYIEMPDSVSYLSSEVFYDCISLKTIIFPSKIVESSLTTFIGKVMPFLINENNANKITVYVPRNLIEYYKKLFENKVNVVEIQ